MIVIILLNQDALLTNRGIVGVAKASFFSGEEV